MARRKKRKLKTSSKIMFSALFLFIALAVLALTIPPFEISSIKVNGINKLTEDEVKAMSGIQIGNNVFRTNIKRAEKNIEGNPYVTNATIYRKFPARIEINIEEAELFAEIKNGEEYAGIDKNGKVLERSKKRKKGVMTVEGLTPVKCDEGERIEYESEDYFKIQTELFNQIEKNGLSGKIKTLNLENRSYITMETTDGLKVFIGTGDELDYKMQYVKIMCESEEYKTGVFDITNTNQPTHRKNK